MSHFIGLVFVDPMENDLDTMLEPFDEQTEDPAYLEFVDKTDEVKKTFEEMPDSCPSTGTYTRTIDETDLINRIWDEAPDELEEEQEKAFWKPYNKKDYPTPADIAKDKEYTIVPDEAKRNGLRYERSYEANWEYEPSKAKYPTMKELAEGYFGYKKKGNKYGYTHNPQAKWDWYSEGGRWGGFLINKEGNNTDCDLLTEIDWDKMFRPDKDGYDRIPFCFVDTYGNWHEKGEMGWFAMVANEKKKVDWHDEFKSYVKSLLAEAYDEDGNPYEDGVQVYAIDFHI